MALANTSAPARMLPPKRMATSARREAVSSGTSRRAQNRTIVLMLRPVSSILPGWQLAAGMIAAVQMTVVVAVDEATRPGYDPYRNWVSQLALGHRGWVEMLTLAAGGAWLWAYAIGLDR